MAMEAGLVKMEEQEMLEEIQAALRDPECRLTFGFAFSLNGAVQNVTVEKRGENRRWQQVGVPLYPADMHEGTRADLLRLVAGLLEA